MVAPRRSTEMARWARCCQPRAGHRIRRYRVGPYHRAVQRRDRNHPGRRPTSCRGPVHGDPNSRLHPPEQCDVATILSLVSDIGETKPGSGFGEFDDSPCWRAQMGVRPWTRGSQGRRRRPRPAPLATDLRRASSRPTAPRPAGTTQPSIEQAAPQMDADRTGSDGIIGASDDIDTDRMDRRPRPRR
jgi:hypothetical protein